MTDWPMRLRESAAIWRIFGREQSRLCLPKRPQSPPQLPWRHPPKTTEKGLTSLALLYLPCKRGLESFIDLPNLFCSTTLKSRICIKQNVPGIVHAFFCSYVYDFFLGNFCTEWAHERRYYRILIGLVKVNSLHFTTEQ